MRRLTEKEWSALQDAVISLEGEIEGESDPAEWRRLDAANRALDKIRDQLAPTVKRG